jgi:hypothetical protein
MVSRARGSIFRRTDGKYFIYLPTRLVEDTAFPLKVKDKPTNIRIHFKYGDKKSVVEKK